MNLIYAAINTNEKFQKDYRLVNKIKDNANKICKFEEKNIDDAEVVILSYGCTSRIAEWAVLMAREKGIKAGYFRLIVAWRFPEKRIREIRERMIKSKLHYTRKSKY